MKAKKTIFFLIFSFILLSLYSCGDKKPKPEEEKLLAHIPMPAKLDSAMRHSFDSTTYIVLKQLNPKNIKSFKVSKDNYIKMIDNIPANANRVAFSFVQFNKASFSEKYKELSNFDGCLYLVYFYMDDKGNNLGDKAYAMLGTKDIVEITGTDYKIMVNDYVKNIKPSIDKEVKGQQGNTLTLKIDKAELLAYRERVISKANVKDFKITLAQIVKFNEHLTKNEIDVLTNKLSLFKDENIGQMTFITDSENNNGGNVENLSGFDLILPCPYDCP